MRELPTFIVYTGGLESFRKEGRSLESVHLRRHNQALAPAELSSALQGNPIFMIRACLFGRQGAQKAHEGLI
jgi:hypothetical protein